MRRGGRSLFAARCGCHRPARGSTTCSRPRGCSSTQATRRTARRRLTEARSRREPRSAESDHRVGARVEVGDRRPQAALDLLATCAAAVDAGTCATRRAVRGQALFQLGRHVDAVRTLVDREVWLEDSASILANQRLIWDGFRRFPLTAPPAPTRRPDRRRVARRSRRSRAPATADLRRSLLALARDVHGSPRGRRAARRAPRPRNGPPAASRSRSRCCCRSLPARAAQRRDPRRLLVAAHLADATGSDTVIRVYDTAARRAASRSICARSSTAPISSSARCCARRWIRSSAQAGFVPTLALNYAQVEAPASRGFYQFGALVGRRGARATRTPRPMPARRRRSRSYRATPAVID